MSEEMERIGMPDYREREEKKPYTKPKLTAYGDVREITRAGGTKAQPDGSGPSSMNMIKS
jgi:hypothetical protein